MTSFRKQIALSGLLLLGAAAASALMYLSRPDTPIAEPEYRPVSVDAAQVVRETVRVQVQAQGTVTPLRETGIVAEVSGRIVEVADGYLVGGYVPEGEVLVRIDPRDYQTNLLRAKAAVAQAESNLVQEKGRAEVALREWQKLPAGSQRSDEARDLYLRKPQLEQAEAQLLAARADLDTARDNLERTVVRAPYNAIIRARHSELGRYVTPGAAIADLFAVDVAEVRLPIPQSRLDYLELPGLDGFSEGAAIDLYTDVGGEVKHWPATLHRTEAVFDERSRALFMVARVDDPYALLDTARQPLRIGTFVNADISGRAIENIVTLPRHILRPGNYLWIIDDDNILRNRQVSVLRTGGDRILVDSGLDDGELVSLTNVDSSLNGSAVTLRTVTPSNRLDDRDANAAAVERTAQEEQAATAGAEAS